MSEHYKFTGQSENGRITFDDPAKALIWLSINKGKIAGELKRWHPKRSNEQRDFVMGVWMPIILNELGYFPHESERVYNECKRDFWYEERTSKSGIVTRIIKKTRENNTKEYMDFMEAFRGWAWDVHQIELPDPDFTKSKKFKQSAQMMAGVK